MIEGYKRQGSGREALNDLLLSVKSWRIWLVLSMAEIRSRYLRSKLGQFWITLSMALMVVILGFVWSFIFRVEVAEYLPYVAIGLILWTYISASLGESSSCFLDMKPYLNELSLPKSVPFFYCMTKNLVTFGHNFAIVPVILVVYKIGVSFSVLSAIAGLLILIATLFGLFMLNGILGSRYGDYKNLVANVLQISFYLTPVLWRPELIGNERIRNLLAMNPFAILIRLIRDPLLGNPVIYGDYLLGVIIAAVSLLVGFSAFAIARKRVNYWI